MSQHRRWPRNFSYEERRIALALLQRAKQSIQPYKGEWKAPWLLSDIKSPVWQIRNKDTRLVNGRWVGALDSDWSIPLDDGTKLTDAINGNMCAVARQAAFLVREQANSTLRTTGTFMAWLLVCKTIVQWLYFHSDRFSPRTDYFRRVDGHAIAEYIHVFAEGGKAGLFQLTDRCLELFYTQALRDNPPGHAQEHPLAIPSKERSKIIKWLTDAGYYEAESSNHPDYISRVRLAATLNVGPDAFMNRKMTVFLRQFEPAYAELGGDLLIPTSKRKSECWSHRIPLLTELKNNTSAETTCRLHLSVWSDLLRIHRHLPHALPDTTYVDLRRARYIAQRESTPVKHTPWIPLKTALAYTTEALRWVSQWGDELVDFYIKAIEHFDRHDLFSEDRDDDRLDPKRQRKRQVRDEWINAHLPQHLKVLNIRGWSTLFARGRTDDIYNRFRAQPSLNDALEVLTGAIILLIGITKPIRESEIRHLRKDCLRQSADGHWLEQVFRKRNIGDRLLDSERPIPSIVARGLAMMQRLSEALCHARNERDIYAKQSLFYVPTFNRTASLAPSVITARMLTQCLDRLCDFVNLPPDAHGRRWYARVHELRKSFLITFFWCFKFSSLDAARWIAGHKEAETIYAYITANFPGMELPRLEAEYTHQQMMDFANSRDADETENLHKLYRTVCKHFGVSEITTVPEKELMEWLETAFRKGIYKIRVFNVTSRDGLVKTTIAYQIEKGEPSEKETKARQRNRRQSALPPHGGTAKKRARL